MLMIRRPSGLYAASRELVKRPSLADVLRYGIRGGAPGFSFISSAGGNNNASGTTLDCSASLNVAAGDLLVAWSSHEGGPTTHAVAKDSGSPTNAHTFDAEDEIERPTTVLFGAWGYRLSASADSAAIFRQTLGAAQVARRIIVMQFRPDSGATVTKEAGAAGAHGASAAPASLAKSPSGTDLVACGSAHTFSNDPTTSELINGVSATEPAASPQDIVSSVWYRILTSGFSSGTASATYAATADWICSLIVFKAVGAAIDSALLAAMQYPPQGPIITRYRMVPYGDTGYHRE